MAAESNDPRVQLTRWSGWDPTAGTPDGMRHFLPPAGDGSAASYQLLALAGRGFRPPKYLSVVDTVVDSDAGEVHPGYRETWSMLYRQLVETRSPEQTPFAIYLLGVNPPEGLSDAELDVFNDFYTTVHLPEVAERRHALRAVRYELVSELRPPYRGAPRFLAVYEMDEEAASHRRHSGPAYTQGPEIWQRHTTPWRLWYRRLNSESGESGRQ